MPLATTYSLDYLKKLIKAIYDNTVAKKETYYDKYMNIVDTDDLYEIWSQDSGLGNWSPVLEGQPVPIDYPVKGGQKRVELIKYGLGFAVTERMRRFEKYDRVAVLTRQLALKGMETLDITAASVLNNAFSSSYAGFESGKALCANNHVILRTGATIANTPSTAVSIGLTAFQLALTHFASLPDDSGAPFPMKIAYLVTHPNNTVIVQEILKSQLVPHSADNTVNIYKDLVQPIFNPYLTSTTSWFFLGPKDESLKTGDGHSLFILMNKKPTVRDYVDPATETLYVIGEGDWNVGYLHWRGVYGDEGV